MSLLIFLLTSLVGGAGSPLIKFTVSYFPTVTFVALRGFLSALLIFPFVYQEIFRFKPKHIKHLILANVLFALNWLFFAMGIQKTSILMGQLIYLPTAPIVAITAYFFLRERLSKEQFYGLIITLIGFAVLLFGSVKSQDTLSFGTPLGNLLVIGGLFCWSFYTVVSRRLSATYKPQVITFFNFLFTAIITSLFIPVDFQNRSFEIFKIPSSAVFGIFGVLVISSILFFLLYQWLVKRTSAFISSLVVYPITVFAGSAGIIFFNERLTPNFILGGMLVLIGVFLASSYNYIRSNFKYAN